MTSNIVMIKELEVTEREPIVAVFRYRFEDHFEEVKDNLSPTVTLTQQLKEKLSPTKVVRDGNTLHCHPDVEFDSNELYHHIGMLTGEQRTVLPSTMNPISWLRWFKEEWTDDINTQKVQTVDATVPFEKRFGDR